jgi:hypothetical protein
MPAVRAVCLQIHSSRARNSSGLTCVKPGNGPRIVCGPDLWSIGNGARRVELLALHGVPGEVESPALWPRRCAPSAGSVPMKTPMVLKIPAETVNVVGSSRRSGSRVS